MAEDHKHELHVQVQDQDVIVAMPGTSFKATYRAYMGELVEFVFISGNRDAPISSAEFKAVSRAAADKHAREMGWIE
ncbi:MAG: hypothetical protein WA446_17140 [Steroidobacteraceae bacterium]